MQVVDALRLFLGQPQGKRAVTFVQTLVDLLRGFQAKTQGLIPLRFLFQAGHGLFDGSHVRQDQLGLDGVDVGCGIHPAGDMHDIRVAEETDNLADRVGFADVRKELVAQALALGRTRNQAGDIHELDGRGDDACGIVDFRQAVQAGVGNGNDAHVGFDGGEGIVRRKAALIGEGGKQRGLAHVGQADDADGKCHGDSFMTLPFCLTDL